MPPTGIAKRKNINLGQKRVCGRIDSRAGVYGGCYAYEEGSIHHNEFCHLGYKCKNGKPLEPCLKPKTAMQYSYALKLKGLI